MAGGAGPNLRWISCSMFLISPLPQHSWHSQVYEIASKVILEFGGTSDVLFYVLELDVVCGITGLGLVALDSVGKSIGWVRSHRLYFATSYETNKEHMSGTRKTNNGRRAKREKLKVGDKCCD